LKRRTVSLSSRAVDDLERMHTQIVERAGRRSADTFVGRIKSFILGMDIASERGTKRADLRKNLRIVGFEKRITIAFVATESQVQVLRIFWGGQNWEREF
jgi:toxin ParE1/3/4